MRAGRPPTSAGSEVVRFALPAACGFALAWLVGDDLKMHRTRSRPGAFRGNNAPGRAGAHSTGASSRQSAPSRQLSSGPSRRCSSPARM